MQKPSLLLFNDLIEAFGQVVRKWLFESIYQRFPPETEPKLFRLLESLWSKTATSLAQNSDDIFELLLGVRQGGPESPPPYNMYMDYIMWVYLKVCQDNNFQFLRLKNRIRSTATTREEQANEVDGDHIVGWWFRACIWKYRRSWKRAKTSVRDISSIPSPNKCFKNENDDSEF